MNSDKIPVKSSELFCGMDQDHHSSVSVYKLDQL